MRVRYTGPTEDSPPVPEDGRYHLIPGNEYAVLELHIQSDGSSSLRIEDSADSLAGLYSGKFFEQLSGVIPDEWSIELRAQGGLSMGPREWIVGDFWERMMERLPEAEATYDAMREAILRQDPLA
ncbi:MULTISPECIES: hypothetical protein [Streptomyces]|uniref:Uncharacterized protein n=1 Tax=Streptomyces flavovirens TaxID=52258 RepID=A0ABV8NGG6_9ACTN|nr:hypothetical protein [Streptomyces sp. MBT51]MBK3596324.1 hypothetical protein [Streptomyces sp. MBT51]